MTPFFIIKICIFVAHLNKVNFGERTVLSLSSSFFKIKPCNHLSSLIKSRRSPENRLQKVTRKKTGQK